VATELLVDLELLLTDAMLSYGDHVACGRIDAESIYEDWQNPQRRFDPVLALTGVLVAGGSARTALAALRPPHPEYERLLTTLAQYRAVHDTGGWPTIPGGATLHEGECDPRVPLLRERFLATGDLTTEPNVGDAAEGRQYGVPLFPAADVTDATEVTDATGATSASTPHEALLYDAPLARATERFQGRHGLAEDGVIGENTVTALNVPVEDRIDLITLNLERLRWLPRDFGKRYIRVNIPALRLEVIEDQQTVLSMRAIVGRADRPTPVFSGKLTYLEFNPYWTIPLKLAQEDLLPRIQSDPEYLSERGIHVFSDWQRQSPEIDPYAIDWAQINPEDLAYKLRQEPGPRNPLGRVKFMFPNRFAVYIHDTTSRAKFRRPSRYYSSGCIRIEDPLALANYLLADRRGWDDEGMHDVIESRENKTVGLFEPIPVHLFYLSSWVSNAGVVNFRSDVYSYDSLLQEALAVRSATLLSSRVAALTSSDGDLTSGGGDLTSGSGDAVATRHTVVAQLDLKRANIASTGRTDAAAGAVDAADRDASLTNALTGDTPRGDASGSAHGDASGSARGGAGGSAISAAPNVGDIPEAE
jgi:murein L,D-transpeptidase YcbB/YkuD